MALMLLVVLLLPFLTYAQNSTTDSSSSSSSPSPSPSSTVITSTSLSTFVTAGSTVIATSVFTTAQPISTSNSTTNSTNNSTTSSTPTTTIILPTAPTNVNGGGQGGAPSPGQTGVGGIYGPPDTYIAAATSLARKGLAAGLVGSLIGGALVVL